jgi:hypothetical protein
MIRNPSRDQREDIEAFPGAIRNVIRGPGVVGGDDTVTASVRVDVPPAVRDRDVLGWLVGVIEAAGLPDGWTLRGSCIQMRDYREPEAGQPGEPLGRDRGDRDPADSPFTGG